MPFYDRKCSNGHEKQDSYEPVTTPFLPCETCGAPTERVWLSKAGHVIADDIPGGMVLEHVVPGRKVYSQTELRRLLKEHGYQQHVEHVPDKGSDKSKHTAQWVAIPVNEEARLKSWHEHEAKLQAELTNNLAIASATA